MNRSFISAVLTLHIHVQRFKDHFLRSLTGVPRPKRSMILPELYLGGQYSLRALQKFQTWGITAIVNMRMHSIHRDVSALSVKMLHLPTPDYFAPTQKQLEKGIQFIKEEIEQGGKVYIHCRQGEGRGPTMAIAYLLSTGLTLEHAIQLIKKVRTFISPTRHQLDALKLLEKNMVLTEEKAA